jgi:hypothetical protein
VHKRLLEEIGQVAAAAGIRLDLFLALGFAPATFLARW